MHCGLNMYVKYKTFALFTENLRFGDTRFHLDGDEERKTENTINNNKNVN